MKCWFVAVLPLLIQIVKAQFNTQTENKKCERVDIDICKFSASSGYNSTMFPNAYNHRTQDEAKKELMQFSALIKTGCYKDLALYLCSEYVPLCLEDMKMTLKPCRSLCEQAKKGCSAILEQYSFNWPFDCSKLPSDDEICLTSLAEPTKKSATINTTPTTNVTISVVGSTKKPKRKRGKVSGIENAMLEIKCKKGKVVGIRKVVHVDSKCCPEATKQVLSAMCHQKRTCKFSVSQNTFGGHCMGTVGKVSIKYKCEKPSKEKKRC